MTAVHKDDVTNEHFVVCAMYKFVGLPNFEALRKPLLEVMEANEVRGTLLLAAEGINGTISAKREGIDNLLAWLDTQENLKDIVTKESYDDECPFYRTKVKLKNEIVTMGVEGVDPLKVVGSYVKPKEWNALISDPEVILIDTRNDYEIEIGTFQNAVDPNTKTFREFPQWAKENLDPEKHKKVAMFCTGGIRCEKSTAYMKEQGFDEVYHLEGGILKYLEKTSIKKSRWKGEGFVFDSRVSVKNELKEGTYDLCHACRHPVSEDEKKSSKFKNGISCPKCYGKISNKKIKNLKERNKQILISKRMGIYNPYIKQTTSNF